MRVVLRIFVVVYVSVSVYDNESNVLYDKIRIVKRRFIVILSMSSFSGCLQAKTENISTATRQ